MNDHSENMEQPLTSQPGGEGDMNPSLPHIVVKYVLIVYLKSQPRQQAHLLYIFQKY